jgi:hypothetical protein
MSSEAYFCDIDHFVSCGHDLVKAIDDIVCGRSELVTDEHEMHTESSLNIAQEEEGTASQDGDGHPRRWSIKIAAVTSFINV